MQRTSDLELQLGSNIGPKERVARFMVSFGLLVVAMLTAGWDLDFSAISTVLSVALFVTAWFRFCPVGALLGRSMG